MRFHIGFSKFIKPKKLIEILGFLFLGLLAFFGFVENNIVLAENLFPSCDTSDSTHAKFLNYSTSYYDTTNFDEIKQETDLPLYCNVYNVNSVTTIPRIDSNLNYKKNTSFQVASSTSNTPFFINDEMTYYFSNNQYCNNDTTELKSINFTIPISYINTSRLNYSTFNRTGLSDSLNLMMVAYDDTHNLNFSTTCSLEASYTNGLSAVFQCDNVFNGNSNYHIDRFGIRFLNGVPFNDWVISNSSTDSINFNNIWILDSTGYYDFSYTCSDEQPDVEGGFPVDDDPAGLNDIYNEIKGNYNIDIPGIDTTNFLTIPNSMADLFMLPLNLINIVVENSDTCSTYEIDFSSIMVKWGNPTDEYKLRLPCMREVLSNKLGAFYTLCDYLMATFVFYNIIMNLLQLIDAITSGEDIYSYFFKRENQSSNNGGYKHYNSDTGEVW